MRNIILEKGKTVLVNIQGILPFKAVMLEQKTDKLILKLSNGFSIYNLHSKDRIALSYEAFDLLQMIDCIVIAVDIQGNTIEIEIKQVSAFDNKREAERKSTSFNVNIVKLESGEEVIANVRNVSLGGMKVFSKANLPINQKIKVSAALKEQKMDFIGIVKWKTELENYFEYGISNIYNGT